MSKRLVVILVFTLIVLNSIFPMSLAIDLDESDDSIVILDEEVAKGAVVFPDYQWTFDDEKIKEAVSKGMPDPRELVVEASYKPKTLDIVGFDYSLKDEALFASLKHKGFEGVEVTYEKTEYSWSDFFDNIEYFGSESDLTIILKGDNIYELEVYDEFSKNYRYHLAEDGIFYELSEIMMGAYDQDPSTYTKKEMGYSCYYGPIDPKPSHNPFILQSGETILKCMITEVQNKAMIYIETELNEDLHKKWIDIENGLLHKELVFDSDGLLESKKELKSYSLITVDDSIFIAPKHVDYKDITLFIFALEGGDIETFAEAVENTLPSKPFSMTLESDEDEYIVHCGGFDDDMSLDNPIYLYTGKDKNGDELHFKTFRKGPRFNTVVEEKRLVVQYDTSCFEKKFFDFAKAGLRDVVRTDTEAIYSFENIHKGSISGMIEFYDYTVDLNTRKIKHVAVYMKENRKDKDAYGPVMVYSVGAFGEADESLFSVPMTYKVIDHGSGSHNDGEHVPEWYE